MFLWIPILALTFAEAQRVAPTEIDASLNGKDILVEGVFSSKVGAGEHAIIYLKQCKAKFQPHSIKLDALDELKGTWVNVRIGGRVTVENDSKNGSVIVLMTSFRTLPDDRQQYSTRELKIAPDDEEGWYELSKWVTERYEQYENPVLRGLGLSAYKRGLEIQYKKAEGKPDKLREYGARIVKDKVIASFDANSLEHEILRAEFAKVKKDIAEELLAFAPKIRTRVPAAEAKSATIDPVTKLPTSPSLNDRERKSYANNPLNAYSQAKPDVRKLLARNWEANLVQEARRIQVRTRELEFFAAAEKAELEAPDYPQFALEFNRRGIEDRLSRVAELTKREIENLVQKMKSVNNDEAGGAQLRDKWLKIQLERIKTSEEQANKNSGDSRQPAPRDAQARFDLATTILEWFPTDTQYRTKVRGLLAECLEIDPSMNQAAEKLKDIGYIKNSTGVWIDARAEIAEDERNKQRNQTVKKGDSPEMVRATFGGEPDSKSRIAGKDWVLHQWIFKTTTGAHCITLRETPSTGTIRVEQVREIK